MTTDAVGFMTTAHAQTHLAMDYQVADLELGLKGSAASSAFPT